MMKWVNNLLNSITMYRLMLYYLIFLVGMATILSILSILPYSPIDILGSALYLCTICWFTNIFIAKIFKTTPNIESAPITALILSLIVGPVSILTDLGFLTILGILAMASKYLVAINRKHLFNPAAFTVVVSAVFLGQGASWWIGNIYMFPAIILGGLLILKKIRRYSLVGTYLVGFILVNLVFGLLGRSFPIEIITHSPILFFVMVMLIEPLTSPITYKMQIIYSLIVLGSFIVSPFILPDIYYGLELSLLIGNIFAFIINPKFNKILKLKEKKQLTPNVIEYIFEPFGQFNFKAGQFLEWTLNHSPVDTRGNRRFFTISSSPTEDSVILTTKFYEKPSTFKQALIKMEPGAEILASHLGGEFTLPADPSQKLVFIAGGIGVTPFRSMIKYLIDKTEKRDIYLLYSNKTAEDIVFKEVFDKAKNLGVKTIYINTDKDGFIDEKLIKDKIKDWKERLFYVSGPEPMVAAFEKMLSKMGLSIKQIKRDYFPGYIENK